MLGGGDVEVSNWSAHNEKCCVKPSLVPRRSPPALSIDLVRNVVTSRNKARDVTKICAKLSEREQNAWVLGLCETVFFKSLRSGHTRGPFPESPDNFSGPESYFMSLKFTLKIQILFVFKAQK